MKDKFLSLVFLALGIVIILASVYAVLVFSGSVLSAIVDFVANNDLNKIKSQCAAYVPAQFEDIKRDFATVILPMLYLGVPVTLIILSALMFQAGYYRRKAEEMESEKSLEHKYKEKIKEKGEHEHERRHEEIEEM
ncbi:MAG: hypothetical protein ACPL06_00960 [Candidatus Anstonellales archaeon]